MEIFISRDGQKLGPYPIEQVRKLLDQGILQANDLAYHKGLDNWVMLSELDAITTNHSKTFEPNKVQAPPAFPFQPKKEQSKQGLAVIVLVTLILGLAGLGALGAWYISEREEIEAAKDSSIIHSRETATFQPEPIKPTLEPTPEISPIEDKSFASVSGAACLKLGKELLENKNFQEIENAIEFYTKTKSRSFDGSWNLYLFYEGLMGAISSNNSDERFRQQLNRIEVWIQKNPESTNALIAKALLLDRHAWKARGGGTSDTVTDNGYKIFNERLGEAYRILAQIKTRDNPLFYLAFQKISTGLSMPKENYYELVSEGSKRFPEFEPIYTTTVWHLSPKWYGDANEWQNYRDSVVSMAALHRKEELYYFISAYGFKFNRVTHQAQNTDWKTFKNGGEKWLALYPSANRQEYICILACIEADKPTAIRYFLREQENSPYRSSDWVRYTGQSVDYWRNWALDGRSWETAFEKLKYQAQNGDSNYQYEIGLVISMRFGAVHRIHSLKWLDKASEQGHELAKNHAKAIRREQVFAANSNPIGQEVQQAAQMGYGFAQNTLGRSYLRGVGIKQNHSTAIKWLERAANQGNVNSQFTLADFFHSAGNSQRDRQKAAFWAVVMSRKGKSKTDRIKSLINKILSKAKPDELEKAQAMAAAFVSVKELSNDKLKTLAEEGNPRAQHTIGLRLITGTEGLQRSPKTAIEWWLRSAKQGWGPSQANLVNVYSRGRNIPKDLVQAYFWAQVAYKNGESNSRQTGLRIEKEMTPAQIQKALTLAKNFKPVIEKPAELDPSTKPESSDDDKKPGTVLWEFETGSVVESSPAIGSDGTVYVGSMGTKLYAINGKTGVKLWEFETGRPVFSSPAIGSDGTVYVGSADTKLYAIKADSKGLAKSPWPMRGQNAQHTGHALKTNTVSAKPKLTQKQILQFFNEVMLGEWTGVDKDTGEVVEKFTIEWHEKPKSVKANITIFEEGKITDQQITFITTYDPKLDLFVEKSAAKNGQPEQIRHFRWNPIDQIMTAKIIKPKPEPGTDVKINWKKTAPNIWNFNIQVFKEGEKFFSQQTIQTRKAVPVEK